MKKQQYKNKKFKSEKEFNFWLKVHTKIKIIFEDKGQDCLIWLVDKNGEVLHSELQSNIWNGKMVNLKKIKIGENILLQDGTYIFFRVKKIINYT